MKLKVSQKYHKFYGSHNAPEGVSQQPLPFSVLRAGNRALLGGDTFGALNQQEGVPRSHYRAGSTIQ